MRETPRPFDGHRMDIAAFRISSRAPMRVPPRGVALGGLHTLVLFSNNTLTFLFFPSIHTVANTQTSPLCRIRCTCRSTRRHDGERVRGEWALCVFFSFGDVEVLLFSISWNTVSKPRAGGWGSSYRSTKKSMAHTPLFDCGRSPPPPLSPRAVIHERPSQHRPNSRVAPRLNRAPPAGAPPPPAPAPARPLYRAPRPCTSCRPSLRCRPRRWWRWMLAHHSTASPWLKPTSRWLCCGWRRAVATTTATRRALRSASPVPTRCSVRGPLWRRQPAPSGPPSHLSWCPSFATFRRGALCTCPLQETASPARPPRARPL